MPKAPKAGKKDYIPLRMPTHDSFEVDNSLDDMTDNLVAPKVPSYVQHDNYCDKTPSFMNDGGLKVSICNNEDTRSEPPSPRGKGYGELNHGTI